MRPKLLRVLLLGMTWPGARQKSGGKVLRESGELGSRRRGMMEAE